jgi:hypothetical protein
VSGAASPCGDNSVDPFVKAGKMRFTRTREFICRMPTKE